MKHWLVTVLLLFTAVGVQAQTDEPRLLSAYFGLDNTIPLGIIGVCRGGVNNDGMPVIFALPVEDDTLQAEDFVVITTSGAELTPRCAVLTPAIDPGENRTALLIGELGDAANDPPVRVEIVGDILAQEVNFLGAQVEVTPLDAGPVLVLAERVPPAEWKLDAVAGRQTGDGCPGVGTIQIVRVTWAGGIARPNDGGEAADHERQQYRVTLADGTEVTPFALADLGDGDNHHLLCLDVPGEPASVFFPAGYLVDPNDDATNPDTTAAVTGQPSPPNYRNLRYCEIIPIYRQGLTLRSEVYNTLGLNDCPAEAWAALDAETLQTELGAVTVRVNGPRYWVLDEIIAVGGVTVSGTQATFGGIDMTLRAVLETRIGGTTVGQEVYTPLTVQRDTRYIYYAGELVYELVSPEGDVYIMQSYAQIADPTLTIDDLPNLGERLNLPAGWTYRARRLDDHFILASGGEANVINDELFNTYQRINP